MRHRGSVLAAVLAAWALSCGTDKGGATDGATKDGQATTDAAVIACSPAAQDCLSGMKCDFFCNGTVATIGCRADSTMGGDLGAACGGTMVCKKGGGCLAAAMSSAACKKYCNTDADCSTGTCQVVMVTVTCGGATGMPLPMKVCI